MKQLMNAIAKIAVIAVMLVTDSAVSQGVLIGKAQDKTVVYSPSTTTEALLAKYSQFHSRPNEYWQLTDEEWVRYETIKKNSPWAQWRNNASPLSILSHYAESMDEKRRYARMEAEIDTWRQHSTTEFQSLYDKERKIVYERYVEWFNKRQPTLATLKPYDRLRLFVKAGDCDVHCRSLVTRVLKTQAKTDIYVVGAKSDDEIFGWAERANIPVERVKTKEITLNHDNGVFKLVADGVSLPLQKLPSLFRQTPSGDQSVAI